MNSKIAIIIGHPYEESYCAALATAYKKGAIESGAKVQTIDLSKLEFDPNLRFGYSRRMELEKDLVNAQETIRWADHLVFVYPIWWASVPAIMKGFIDRTFLPDFAYQTRPNSLLWDKLLTGKSARLIVTMDTPSWYDRIVYKQAGHRVMKHGTLKFCGVNPVRITEFNSLRTSTARKREQWLVKIHKLGTKLG